MAEAKSYHSPYHVIFNFNWISYWKKDSNKTCREVQLKIHGARRSAQILKSDGPSEMQHLASVVCNGRATQQPRASAPENEHRSLSAPKLFPGNWSHNYTDLKGICSPCFIPVSHCFDYFKMRLSIFITTDQPKQINLCVKLMNFPLN